MKKIIISLFVCLFTTISHGQTFDDMISIATMASGAWDQSVHGWAQDPDNEWRYHFDLNRTSDIVFDMSIGLKRSSSNDNFHEAKVYVILTHPTDQGTFWKISPDVLFTPADFTAQGSSGNYSRNRTAQVTIPQQLFNSYFAPGNFPLNYRISVAVEGKMHYLGTFETFKNYHQEKYREYAIKPIIQGPSQVCAEEIFNISYASNVTLENSSGIAMLTSLGGNQYKITRTAAMSGNVILKATNSSMESITKTVTVGAFISGTIGGMPNWEFGDYSEVDYDIALPDGITDINWTVSGHSKVIATKINNNTVRLSTNGAIPFRTNVNLTLRAFGVGPCGTTINYVSKTIPFGYNRL